MGLMSKLDAVNEMLFNSGEQLVTSLTDDLNTDVNLAVFILDQATLEAQLRGMAVNRRPIKVFPSRTGPTGHTARPISDSTKGRVELSPYSDNMITGSLISAQLVTEKISDDLDIKITTAPRRFGIESNGTDYNVLYNVTDNTDEFDTNTELTINIVEYIEFKDLETTVQKGIAASASRQYQMFVQGDRDVDRLLAERAAMLTAKGRSADANDKARNIFASGDSALRRVVSQRGNAYNDPGRFRFWRYTT